MSNFLQSKLDPDCRILLIKISEMYGKILISNSPMIKIISVNSYQDAIVELENDPDIIITDMSLDNGKTGLDVSLETRLRDMNTQVIILTSNPDPEMMIRAIQYDIYDYLIAPVNEDALVRSISRALEKKNLLDQKLNLENSLKAFQEKVSDIIRFKKQITELDTELLTAALDFEESRKTSSSKLNKITNELKKARILTKQKTTDEDNNE